MIGCSPVEMNVIYQIYGDVMQALLCCWHAKRAREKGIKKLIKVENSTDETAENQRQTRAT